jgi:hypothetical protein
MKTLAFCTAFANSLDGWNLRYRTWLDGIKATSLHLDQVLMIDDGSPVLPNWPDVATVCSLQDDTRSSHVVLYHFYQNLGKALDPWPGWQRSFVFAAIYARHHGFEKVIHVESDAFIISERLSTFFNEMNNEWVTLWCPKHSMPESGVQAMAGTGLDLFYEFAIKPYNERIGPTAEHGFPRTRVEKGFNGDRYGEYREDIPEDADFAMQANAAKYRTPGYLWWIK